MTVPAGQGEAVLITGASGAIGAALAAAYAAPGRALVLQGRNEARLREAAQACERLGATVETKALDVRDTSALTAWLDGVAQQCPVGLAIVNAGTIHVLPPGAVEEPREEAERVMSVNVGAAIATVTALLPHMRLRGRGQIALVSSLLAWFGLPQAPAYCASKAALKNYGEALRAPLALEGIRVSVVLPGFVESDMSDALRLPKPFMLSPGQAAARIKRGLERDEARISFPLPLAFGCRALSALPPAATRGILALLGFAKT
jgi:short-subunit dehydrogenase